MELHNKKARQPRIVVNNIHKQTKQTLHCFHRSLYDERA